MVKREVVRLAIEGRKVPYIPWQCGFTVEAAEKLRNHFGRDDLDRVLDNHFVKLGHDIGFFTALGKDRFRDWCGIAALTRILVMLWGVSCRSRPWQDMSSPTRWTGDFLRISPNCYRNTGIVSASLRLDFHYTSGPGRCGAWRT